MFLLLRSKLQKRILYLLNFQGEELKEVEMEEDSATEDSQQRATNSEDQNENSDVDEVKNLSEIFNRTKRFFSLRECLTFVHINKHSGSRKLTHVLVNFRFFERGGWEWQYR